MTNMNVTPTNIDHEEIIFGLDTTEYMGSPTEFFELEERITAKAEATRVLAESQARIQVVAERTGAVATEQRVLVAA